MDDSRVDPRTPASVPWRELLLFAAGYFLAGRLGLLFAVPPAFIAAVWPPAGVSLVGALFLGRWAFPAIWLTTFLSGIPLWTSGSLGGLGTAAAMAAATSAGAALHGVLGAFLVRRASGGPFSLSQVRPDELLRMVRRTLEGW